jgi:hypothetical protein
LNLRTYYKAIFYNSFTCINRKDLFLLKLIEYGILNHIIKKLQIKHFIYNLWMLLLLLFKLLNKLKRGYSYVLVY